MTIPQEAPYATHPTTTTTGRGLASAIAVFLGGYLLLASLAAGQLVVVSMGLLTGRQVTSLPDSQVTLMVLQFLFAIAVVVAGLLLGRASIVARLVASAIVLVGSVLTLFLLGARVGGLLPFPSGWSGAPFHMVFGNAWFAVVLLVGVAWLISRRARAGWLAILAVAVLIPLPFVLALNGVEAGLMMIALYGVSAVIGGGIIAASRPWRD